MSSISSQKSIVFLGNERLATATSTTAPVLNALIDGGYKIEAVIANHEDPISRQKRDLEIGLVAKKHDIPVILPGHKINLKTKLLKHAAYAAVLVAFGKFVPPEVIDLFPGGIINLHPSLLPSLRGPTPIETAILHGLSTTGVTLMKITTKMDAGPVYAKQELKLKGTETKYELATLLGEAGAELIATKLPAILDSSLKPRPQTATDATYCELITKADGKIDWNKPAKQLEREVRAYLGWPGSYTKLAGKDVIITEVRMDESHGKPGETFMSHNGMLGVYAGKDALIIERIKPSGKNEMSGAEFARGYLR